MTRDRRGVKVKGAPITEYRGAHRLDIPARLALVRVVWSAEQRAHQKGIIHRDLKPSNVLVEPHVDRPVPKVIDLGLAKAASGLRLTEHSLYTAFGGVAGTPLYMAPEQARFNALDVDIRADIYALGVILRELLTGSTPIAGGDVQAGGPGRDAPGDPRGGAAGAVEPDQHVRTAAQRRRGPARRAGAAVATGPGRPRLDLVTEQIEGEAAGDPLAVARMQVTLGHSQVGLGYPERAIALFTKARTTFSAGLSPDHPNTLNSTADLSINYFDAGQAERALKLGEEALALRKSRLGLDHPDTLAGMINLGSSYAESGQKDRALKLFEETLTLAKAKLGPDHIETVSFLGDQARCLVNSGRLDRAAQIVDQVIASRRNGREEDRRGGAATLFGPRGDGPVGRRDLASGRWARSVVKLTIDLPQTPCAPGSVLS
jgi:tetratricopeptide (TPR) repeat protein